MKPKDIIIATAVILIISSLLNGCTPSSNSSKAKNTISSAQVADIQSMFSNSKMIEKDVEIVLESERDGNKLKVDVYLKNLTSKHLTSVQTWLSYDVDKLKGVDIDTSESYFKLSAPYKNGFDNKRGLLMLGRSGPQPVTDQKIYVANLTFQILSVGNITIDAYDYKEDLKGHTSANITIENKAYNVLKKPESPMLIINSY